MENKNDTYLLNDLALIMTGGEVIQIDNFLDIGLHVTDKLELDIGLKKSAGDLVETFVQNLLVDDRRIAHLLEGTGDAPSKLC